MASQMVLRGVVHGKTIEVEDLPGFPDGQVVAVTVHPVTSAIPSAPRGPLARAETAADISGTPSNVRLRELAAKYQPAKEWFESEEEGVF